MGLPPRQLISLDNLTIGRGEKLHPVRVDRLIQDAWAGDEMGGRGGQPHLGQPPQQLV